MKNMPNTLGEEVAANRWNRVQRPWFLVASDSIRDFPGMTEKDLKIFFTGTCQQAQSVPYLAEILNEDDTPNVRYVAEKSNMLKMEDQSRHVRSKQYGCYIVYEEPDSIGFAGIRRHDCECANGANAQ